MLRFFSRTKICWVLVALLALKLSGCGESGDLTADQTKNAPAAAGPPKDVKDMEKDMMNPKAK